MISLSTASQAFVEHCRHARSLSLNTAQAYTQDLAAFCGFAGVGVQIGEISRRDIEQYAQDAIGQRGLSPRTVRRRLSCLRVFFRWLHTSGHSTRNILEVFHFPIRLPKRLPSTLTRDEVRSLARETERSIALASTRLTQRTATATHLGVLLMAATGLRIAELVAITLADIDGTAGTIRIHGKGDRERTVYIANDKLRRGVQHCMESRRRAPSLCDQLLVNVYGKPLTPSVFRNRLRRAVRAAGIERRITPHMLRHTAATMLLEQGVDIPFIQRLLGHQSISTTQLYVHVTDTSLRAALQKADVIRSLAL